MEGGVEEVGAAHCRSNASTRATIRLCSWHRYQYVIFPDAKLLCFLCYSFRNERRVLLQENAVVLYVAETNDLVLGFGDVISTPKRTTIE